MKEPNIRPRTTRGADGEELFLTLDAAARRPLYLQVYDGLRDAILSGRLRAGERLPSTRVFASDLGVSRNTVLQAYDRLRVEGYVAGRRGGGTRVRATVPDALLTVEPVREASVFGVEGSTAGADESALGVPRRGARVGVREPRPGGSSRDPGPGASPEDTSAPRLSARGAMLAESGARLAARGGTPPIPFRLGVPSLDAFPSRHWARLAARRWRRGTVELGDGDPAGEPELREAIAAHVTKARGARCTPDQVIVVSGLQQGADLAARVLLDPGDAAWVEDPGYRGAHIVLRAAGLRLVPVPVDGNGLDVAAGERVAPEARMAYVTPSHQFPLGMVMSADRRLALIEWAHRAEGWVLEDDYDSEFRYAGRPLACLQGLEAEQTGMTGDGRVIYTGTFSKSLVPGLRLGYLIVPDALVDAFRSARAATDRHPPTPLQGVLADFIGEGHYARHIRRVRALYAERQATLVATAEAELAGLLDIAPAATGLHLIGWLPEGVDGARVANAAAAEGIHVYALSHYYAQAPAPPARDGLVLGYAGFDEPEIRKGIAGLRRALEKVSRM